MNKIIAILIIIFCQLKVTTASNNLGTTLSSGQCILSISTEGLLQIGELNSGNILVEVQLENMLLVELQDVKTRKRYLLSIDEKYNKTRSEDEILIRSNLTSGGKELPVVLELTISKYENMFTFSGKVYCKEVGFRITEIDYANLNIKDYGYEVFWPKGLGEYYSCGNEFDSAVLSYPQGGSASMPWYTLNSQGSGIYVACHDTNREYKNLSLRYNKAGNSFEAGFEKLVYDHEYELPKIVIGKYDGDWHRASQIYRTWWNQNFKIAEYPGWVKNDTGWLLAILKQQNGNLMWSYNDIDELCNIAEEHGLTTIGLFGWANGGHDRSYPNYVPDQLMGGREALKRAIERAHHRGMHIIMYANGKIMDAASEYYLYKGIETLYLDEHGKPNIQFYLKHNNVTPVIFAQACNGSKVWQKTMMDLAIQALDLGADGILYDQIGVMGHKPCFSIYHEHKVGESDDQNRLQMIKNIREEMKKVNPEFIIMTEGTNDLILSEIDYTHGQGKAFAYSKEAFPALYRYTFPELVTTQRNPNPMISRTDANYAFAFGLRHEIECRYTADKEYLLNKVMPDWVDYSNVNSKPNVSLIREVSAEKARIYVHSLVEFENEHAEFFKEGTFIGTDGIKFDGDSIVVNGFKNNNSIGVAVWNMSSFESKKLNVTIDGFEGVELHSPDGGKRSLNDAIPSNSVCLIQFEKLKK